MLLALLASGLAATFTVGTSGAATHGSIAAALAAASPGDTVRVEAGTWAESVDFQGKGVTLVAVEGPERTVIDPGGAAWVAVYLGNGEGPDAVLDGFTVRNAGQRGVWAWGASPTLRNLVIEGTGTPEASGGALVLGYGSPLVQDVVLRDNTGWSGGHAYLEGAAATFERVTMSGGWAYYGGAAILYGSTATFVDSVIEANEAGSAAAGVYLGWGSGLTLTDTALRDNVATAGHGAGIHAEGGATIHVTGGELTGNRTDGWDTLGATGGALYSGGQSTITLADTTVGANEAWAGGGLYLAGSDTLTADTVAFAGNTAAYGGAVWGATTALTDRGSTWDTNSTTYSGGAVYLEYPLAVGHTGSAFLENVAPNGYGGAVYQYGGAPASYADVTFQDNFTYYGAGALVTQLTYGTTTFTGCTFTENTSPYGSAGAIYAGWYSHVAVADSTFTANEAAAGGAVYAYVAGLEVSGSTFTGNRATSTAGGALWAASWYVDAGALTVTDSTFEGNEAWSEGGAIYGRYVPSTRLTGSRFTGNVTGDDGFGGAVFLQDLGGDATVTGNRFALNTAEYGGAAYVDRPGAVGTWTNNVFTENVAGVGGAACIVDAFRERWRNNGFLGNAAAVDGGAVCVVGSSVDLRNNLFAWTRDGAAVHAWAGEGDPAWRFGYNAFFENPEGTTGGDADAAAAGEGTLIGADPLLAGYTLDGDPDDDVLVLLVDSPLRHAGDPDIANPDGSVSDIGPMGGPDAPTTDADGDGSPAWLDCDDTDPTAFPGGFEFWYDGVNGDCTGASDYDQDGDGVDAQDHGGADCDDLDAAVTDCPDAEGPPKADAEGCGCTTGGHGPGGALGLLLAAALLRRR